MGYLARYLAGPNTRARLEGMPTSARHSCRKPWRASPADPGSPRRVGGADDERLRGVAQTLNTDIECFHGCETPNRVYRMTLSGTGLERFPYVPEQILVALNIGTVVAPKPADQISALAGFPMKWQSVPANTASVRLFDTPAKLIKGPLDIATVADGPHAAGYRAPCLKRHQAGNLDQSSKSPHSQAIARSRDTLRICHAKFIWW